MSSYVRIIRVLAMVWLVCLAVMWTPPAAGVDTSPIKISTSAKGAKFRVDGSMYISEATFNWPAGSKHIVEFVVSLDGMQYNDLLNTRYAFTGWVDNLGVLSPTGSLVQTVTADPTVTSLTANVQTTYLIQAVWYEGQAIPPATTPTLAPSVCGGAPGDPVPAEMRVGVIYVDNVCYWNNVALWLSEGTHTLNAFPYPGYVFLGWKADINPPEGFLRSLQVKGPLTISPRFSPAKRVNFRADPPGLSVRIDNTDVLTVESAPCPVSASLPPGAPPGIRAPCTGEFDFAPGSSHIVGARSPQADRYGRVWVFTGFDNGLGQNATYVTGPTVFPEDTVTAKFARGTPVSLTTKPAGLLLNVDDTGEGVATHTFFAPGTKHKVAAPYEQKDAQGRTYRFKRWSNGGSMAQEFVVPESPDLSLTLEAEYDLLSRLVVDSNPKGGTVLVDGTSCAAPCTVDRLPGSLVKIEATAAVAVGDDQQLQFVSWSDGGPRTRSMALNGSEVQQLWVNWTTAYLLRLASDPPEGGRIVASPASADGFYRAGSTVRLTAEPAQGYRLRRWDYDAQGSQTAVDVAMDRGRGVAARFDRTSTAGSLSVRNAAAQLDGAAGVAAAGSLISIFGDVLAADYEAAKVSPILPQSIGGVSVALGGTLLPLLFVGPDQVNAQLPWSAVPGDYDLRVIRRLKPELTAKVRIARSSPGLFRQVTDGVAYVTGQREDGSGIGPERPAKVGDRVTIFATGLGPYQLSVREGISLPAIPKYTLDGPVELYANDQPVPVEWAGGQPGQAGVDAIRFVVPADAPSGPIQLRVKVGEDWSNVVVLLVE